MLKKLLENQYGITVEEYVKLDRYEALRGNGWLYLVSNPSGKEEDDITELEKIAEHLRNYGDQHVPVILPSKDGQLITTWEQNKYCVLANRQIEDQRKIKLGRKLAKFHERGRLVPFQIERSSRIGQWKSLWEKRLEQMEKVWNNLLFQTPEDEFERLFIDSFPYYLGLTENAIQYLVDSEMDDEPTEADGGTVCHERFTQKTWGDHYMIKNPFDWVFDHRSRDLAEWTRERYFRNIQTYDVDVQQFFSEYQSVTPLTSFSWRLLYSRLIFPLHYYDCIESYYITRSEQDKKVLEERLSKILRQTSDYERFLAGFFHMAGAPVRQLNIPQLEWLLT
ncbi:spore coat protein YutH [Bacillus sp. SORGH_AS 510]|uniref:spore coat putative kinase YutH n=1 Tax=Bacillus sp. SORGH_AS_0510 TaxID=3041771 RepID=UPI0027821E81|nr:spore coat protein YutH [Bacillus sp. SORGH_AS_0510]MDQ1144508.1 spore coat protein YutH [Bacillus sp. SORGH_AS_0510]